MKSEYEQQGKGPLCLRKYMLEETLALFQKLWEDSKHNEEQFQAKLKDAWSIHALTFSC